MMLCRSRQRCQDVSFLARCPRSETTINRSRLTRPTSENVPQLTGTHADPTARTVAIFSPTLLLPSLFSSATLVGAIPAPANSSSSASWDIRASVFFNRVLAFFPSFPEDVCFRVLSTCDDPRRRLTSFSPPDSDRSDDHEVGGGIAHRIQWETAEIPDHPAAGSFFLNGGVHGGADHDTPIHSSMRGRDSGFDVRLRPPNSNADILVDAPPDMQHHTSTNMNPADHMMHDPDNQERLGGAGGVPWSGGLDSVEFCFPESNPADLLADCETSGLRGESEEGPFTSLSSRVKVQLGAGRYEGARYEDDMVRLDDEDEEDEEDEEPGGGGHGGGSSPLVAGVVPPPSTSMRGEAMEVDGGGTPPSSHRSSPHLEDDCVLQQELSLLNDSLANFLPELNPSCEEDEVKTTEDESSSREGTTRGPQEMEEAGAPVRIASWIASSAIGSVPSFDCEPVQLDDAADDRSLSVVVSSRSQDSLGMRRELSDSDILFCCASGSFPRPRKSKSAGQLVKARDSLTVARTSSVRIVTPEEEAALVGRVSSRGEDDNQLFVRRSFGGSTTSSGDERVPWGMRTEDLSSPCSLILEDMIAEEGADPSLFVEAESEDKESRIPSLGSENKSLFGADLSGIEASRCIRSSRPDYLPHEDVDAFEETIDAFLSSVKIDGGCLVLPRTPHQQEPPFPAFSAPAALRENAPPTVEVDRDFGVFRQQGLELKPFASSPLTARPGPGLATTAEAQFSDEESIIHAFESSLLVPGAFEAKALLLKRSHTGPMRASSGSMMSQSHSGSFLRHSGGRDAPRLGAQAQSRAVDDSVLRLGGAPMLSPSVQLPMLSKFADPHRFNTNNRSLIGELLSFATDTGDPPTSQAQQMRISSRFLNNLAASGGIDFSQTLPVSGVHGGNPAPGPALTSSSLLAATNQHQTTSFGAGDPAEMRFAPPELVRCEHCQRSFGADRVARHQIFCATRKQNPRRPVFNSQQQRVKQIPDYIVSRSKEEDEKRRKVSKGSDTTMNSTLNGSKISVNSKLSSSSGGSKDAGTGASRGSKDAGTGEQDKKSHSAASRAATGAPSQNSLHPGGNLSPVFKTPCILKTSPKGTSTELLHTGTSAQSDVATSGEMLRTSSELVLVQNRSRRYSLSSKNSMQKSMRESGEEPHELRSPQDHDDTIIVPGAGEQKAPPTMPTANPISETERFPCPHCGREFRPQALEVHSRICMSVFGGKKQRGAKRQAEGAKAAVCGGGAQNGKKQGSVSSGGQGPSAPTTGGGAGGSAKRRSWRGRAKSRCSTSPSMRDKRIPTTKEAFVQSPKRLTPVSALTAAAQPKRRNTKNLLHKAVQVGLRFGIFYMFVSTTLELPVAPHWSSPPTENSKKKQKTTSSIMVDVTAAHHFSAKFCWQF